MKNQNPQSGEHGSGVLISPTRVLTCNHVFSANKPTSKVTITFRDGTVREGRILSRNKVWDLALVEIAPVLYIPGNLSDVAIRKGQRVTICGFPGAGQYVERVGKVNGFRAPNVGMSNYWFTVGTKGGSGMSGGPVFAEDGSIVGILFGSVENSYCVGVDAISRFLEGKPIKRFDIRKR